MFADGFVSLFGYDMLCLAGVELCLLAVYPYHLEELREVFMSFVYPLRYLKPRRQKCDGPVGFHVDISAFLEALYGI